MHCHNTTHKSGERDAVNDFTIFLWASINCPMQMIVRISNMPLIRPHNSRFALMYNQTGWQPVDMPTKGHVIAVLILDLLDLAVTAYTW